MFSIAPLIKRNSFYSRKNTRHHSHVFEHHLTKIKGVTLIELILSTSIVSVLTAIALPNLNSFITQLRVNNEISTLQRLLHTTRNYAINTGSITILCPLTPDGECTTHWHNELSVFVDSNNNQRFDSSENESIIVTKQSIRLNDQLIYGRGRTKIRYHPDGHLSGLSNGTFRYCPDQYTNLSRGVIVARSGRIYASADNNHDGVDENRSNGVMRCD